MKLITDLEDEGVEDGVVHGADVDLEHLEVEALEQRDDLGGLAGDSSGEGAEQHVGAGDPGLDVGGRGVAAGGELLDGAGSVGRRNAAAAIAAAVAAGGDVEGGGASAGAGGRGAAGEEGARAGAGRGAAQAPLLLGLERLQHGVQLPDELDGAADDGRLVDALDVEGRREGPEHLQVVVHLPPPVPLHRDVRHLLLPSSPLGSIPIDRRRAVAGRGSKQRTSAGGYI